MLTFGQFWRAAVTNLLSALIDYSLLFLLSSIFGITSGNGIIPLNLLSFSTATLFSFVVNKHWSFNDHSRFDHHRKFVLFLMVAVVALLVNTAIVRAISTDVRSIPGLGPKEWLFASKLIASVFSFSINFLGYKFIVFKK